MILALFSLTWYFFSRSVSDAVLSIADQQQVFGAAAPSVAFTDYVSLPATAVPAQAAFSSQLGGSATLFSDCGDVSATHVPSTNTSMQSLRHNTVLLATANPLVR